MAPSTTQTVPTPAKYRARRLRHICAGLVAVCLAWALRPLGGGGIAASPVPKPLTQIAAAQPAKTRSLDLATFRTPLWVAPPPPPAPPAPPALPPPLRLQLVGIVTEGGARAALLYDPDQDKLLTMHQGETIQGRTIERITDADVQIRDTVDGPARTLALRADTAGGRP